MQTKKKGSEELACFGGEYFKSDIEGIAIWKGDNGRKYLIISDQQRGYFNVFDAETNAYIKSLNLGTTETDGCDAAAAAFNSTFRKGLFVAMNNDRDFYFYDPGKFDLEANKK